MDDFYENCLSKLKTFAFEDVGHLKKGELYECLRNVFGPETCELLSNPDQPISLTDVQTDLKYLFEKLVHTDNNARDEICPWCNGEGVRQSNKIEWGTRTCVACKGSGKLPPVA